MRFFIISLLIVATTSYADEIQGTTFLQTFIAPDERPSKEYTLSVRKIKDLKTNYGLVPVYNFCLAGVPKDVKLQLVARFVQGFQIQKIFDFINLGNSLFLKFEGALKMEDFFLKNNRISADILVPSLRKGEPFELLVINDKEKTTNSFQLMPYPLKTVIGVDNTKISIMHLANSPEPIFAFEVENLIPGEVLIASSESGIIKKDQHVKVPAAGSFQGFSRPALEGKNEGSACFEIRRKSGITMLNYHWSREETLPPALVIFSLDGEITPKYLEIVEYAFLTKMLQQWIKERQLSSTSTGSAVASP